MSNTKTIVAPKKNENKLNTLKQLNISIVSGIITGTFCSGVFNPWDKALYLAVKCNRPFLSWENFKSPYQGFAQSVVQRAISGSIYYIVQGEMKSNLYPYLRNHGASEASAQFCIGMTAGSINGILTNAIAAVKYHTWGHDSRTFLSSAREMWMFGNIRPFLKGTKATLARDVTFGCTYEILRTFIRDQLTQKNKNKKYNDFICNTTAAGIATIASDAFNYARTMQYATPPNEKTPSITKSLKNLWQQSKNQPPKFLGKIRFFQQKFCIGWGTARVMLGVAVGQTVFDTIRSNLSELNSERLEAQPKNRLK